MTNTPQRGSRTSSPTKLHDSSPTTADALVTVERRASPSKPPTSPPEEGQIIRTPSREHVHSRRGSSSSIVNFVKKNRQACKKCENLSGVPRLAGEPSKETMVVFPTRTKLGRPPVIGDELGTPSLFGSSFFMGPGHYGVREPLPKKTVKKKAENSTKESE